MPLNTTSTLPPGGWVYEQKDDSGRLVKKFRSMSPFRETCLEILKVRQNNNFKRASLEEVMDDVEQSQCQRLGFDPRFCAVKKKTPTFSAGKLFQAAASHLRQSVEAAARRSGQLVDGTQILLEWLGEGATPLQPELSQARADVCTRGFLDDDGNPAPCPFNQPGFKPVESAAEIIRRQVEKKNELKLSVSGEESLHTCKLCWCHLPLKVHVPMKHILAGTPSAMLEKFQRAQPACWIVTENKPTPQNNEPIINSEAIAGSSPVS